LDFEKGERAMHVIAGLGNPGLLYQRTRHNAGYQALDRIAQELHIRVTKRGFSGIYGEGVYNGDRVVLVKPTTYMNLSGDCIQSALRFYKCPVEHLIVLCDDIELPAGSLRIRDKGSAGTHNGMRSVIACVNSEDFPRIRIGVGDREGGRDLKDHVLGRPGKTEQAALESAFCDAVEAAMLILDGRLMEAQAQYNKRHIGGTKAD
jgi:peptidyl-tRNA hydrolase, PTH1 family